MDKVTTINARIITPIGEIFIIFNNYSLYWEGVKKIFILKLAARLGIEPSSIG